MDSKLDRARRLAALLDMLERQERMRLAELDRQIGETQFAQAEVMATLNGESALHGLFVDVIALRMRNLSRSLIGLEKERQEMALRLRDHALRARKAAEMLGAATTAQERYDERRELDAQLEWSLHAVAQGLGKSSQSR